MSVPFPVERDILTALSFLGFVLATIPLTWQLEAWNVGCSLYGIWTSLVCLTQFINHLIWRNTSRNLAPIWCEISIRVIWIGSIGIIAASMTSAHRIAMIALGKHPAGFSPESKRRVILTDLAIGLSIPLVQLVIFYFVQDHRFDIYEGVGCVESTPNTYLLAVLYTGWPIPIGIISAIYCVITLRVLLRRRTELKRLIASKDGLTSHRYYRLMAMCIIEIVLTIPLCGFVLFISFNELDVYPWNGLADLHQDFGRIDEYSAEEWTSIPGFRMNNVSNQCMTFGCAAVYFCFFGLSEEAREHYRQAYNTSKQWVGLPDTWRRSHSRAPSFSRTGTSQPTIEFAHEASSGVSTTQISSHGISSYGKATSFGSVDPDHISYFPMARLPEKSPPERRGLVQPPRYHTRYGEKNRKPSQ